MNSQRHTKNLQIVAGLFLLAFSNACIRPESYRPGNLSTVAFEIPAPHSRNTVLYNHDGGKQVVYEAYIEFDSSGHLFDEGQLTRAVNMIQALKHPADGPERPVSMFLFVHGWKNNASESSGNVWGFRDTLYRQASKLGTEPAIGVYIGWPGDVTRVGKFFSFWNRESVANSVGGGELDGVLTKLLTAVKGANYSPNPGVRPSTAILIGHSMGGLVLERSAIRLIREQLAKYPTNASIPAPADLILLLNEAGPSSQARPFLLELLQDQVKYQSADSQSQLPLLVAMTSDGDAATKIAFPGGEYISPNRPKTLKFQTDAPDPFGLSTTLPYNLLSPANTVALRSHEIVQIASQTNACLVSTTVHKRIYCVKPLDSKPANTTPYWIMPLPQIFVPDHSTIFRREMAQLVDDFVYRQLRTASGDPRPPLKLYKGQ
jgi:hypothetical protein